MRRKALVAGIDHYVSLSPLRGCVNDAHRVKAVLRRHGDGTLNFDTRLMTAPNSNAVVSKAELRQAVMDLFEDDVDIAVFYFAGHGRLDQVDGYICASDTAHEHDGLALSDIVRLANESKAKSRLVVLDSCHGGGAGTSRSGSDCAELREGTTIMTASTMEQYASEVEGAGVFTRLFVDALEGGAANLVGEITPGSVYAHVDRSLGSWEQRPVFKTNVKRFVSLRRVPPAVDPAELRKLPKLFPQPGFEFRLDPSFEPERSGHEVGIPARDALNVETFSVLQKFNRVGLLVPIDAPHMWHAAMGNHACKLTTLGEHYRRLVERERI